MIITIDGLNGVGKSTLARKLSGYFDFSFIDKPIDNFYNHFLTLSKQNMQDMHNIIYKDSVSNLLKAYHTGLSLLYIKENLSDRNIIVNKGLLSSYLVFGDESTNSLYRLLIEKGLLFDLSILLHCDNESRINRLRKRDFQDEELKREENIEIDYDKTFEFIKNNTNNQVLIIDTTKLTSDEVFEIVKNKIEELIVNKRNKQLIKK